MATVEKIPLSSIIPSQNFREDKGDIEGLAASIKEHGLIQPIRLRKLDLGTYEIIAGYRRYEAHKLIGAKEIDAIVVEDQASNAATQRLVENIQRKDLSPLEISRSVSSLRSHFQMDDDTIAKKAGKSKQWVLMYRMLFKLPEETLTRLTSAAESGGAQKVIGATPRHIAGLLRDLPAEEEAVDAQTKQQREEGLKAVERLIDDIEEHDLNVYQTDFITRRVNKGELGYDQALEFARTHKRDITLYSSAIDIDKLPPPIETGSEVEDETWREYKGKLEKMGSLASEISTLASQLKPEILAAFKDENRQKLATYLKEFVLDKLMRSYNILIAHPERDTEQPISIEKRKELPKAPMERSL
jgi:ParB/RepB/Spo0J family partition protein